MGMGASAWGTGTNAAAGWDFRLVVLGMNWKILWRVLSAKEDSVAELLSPAGFDDLMTMNVSVSYFFCI